jgi:hypothetical protein
MINNTKLSQLQNQKNYINVTKTWFFVWIISENVGIANKLESLMPTLWKKTEN